MAVVKSLKRISYYSRRLSWIFKRGRLWRDCFTRLRRVRNDGVVIELIYYDISNKKSTPGVDYAAMRAAQAERTDSQSFFIISSGRTNAGNLLIVEAWPFSIERNQLVIILESINNQITFPISGAHSNWMHSPPLRDK